MAFPAATWWLQEAKHLIVQFPQGSGRDTLQVWGQRHRWAEYAPPTYTIRGLARTLGLPSLAWTQSCPRWAVGHVLSRTFQNAFKNLLSQMDCLGSTALGED